MLLVLHRAKLAGIISRVHYKLPTEKRFMFPWKTPACSPQKKLASSSASGLKSLKWRGVEVSLSFCPTIAAGLYLPTVVRPLGRERIIFPDSATTRIDLPRRSPQNEQLTWRNVQAKNHAKRMSRMESDHGGNVRRGLRLNPQGMRIDIVVQPSTPLIIPNY